jgi:hypothetical protein
VTTNLSGRWAGAYSYPDMFEAVTFEASLVDVDGSLVGETTEPPLPWDFGDRAHALLSGQRSGLAVQLTKVYDTLDDDPVLYEGTIDESGDEIHGRWTIVGEWSGPFVMKRLGKSSVDRAVKAATTV